MVGWEVPLLQPLWLLVVVLFPASSSCAAPAAAAVAAGCVRAVHAVRAVRIVRVVLYVRVRTEPFALLQQRQSLLGQRRVRG